MRTYQENDKNKLAAVICNCCQKKLKVENGIIKEGCFHGDVLFGYFSHKDGTRQTFDLCEECYDKMTAAFALPAESEEAEELL